MPLTVPVLRAILAGRVGPKMVFVGKSADASGPNPDLDLPIALALATLGYPVADYAAISDDDLAPVPGARAYALQGLAELFALRDIWGSFTDVTESQVDRSQSWSSMSAEIAARISALETQYRTFLTILAPLKVGTIRLPFGPRTGPEF